MTVLNFPASPAVNDTYTENNVTYTWNGNYWEANNTGSLDDIYVEVAGDVMTGNLQLPGGGGNTAALQKQEITDLPVSTFDNDSGYITSSDIPPGTVSYWKKDGSVLKPVSDTDNVSIGDGNITLTAADGSSNFTGTITQTGTSNTDDRIDVKTFSDSVFSVNGLGSTTAGKYDLSSASGQGVFLSANGTVAVQHQSGLNNYVFVGYDGQTRTSSIDYDGTTRIGGTLPSAPNIELNAGGDISASNYRPIDTSVGTSFGNADAGTTVYPTLGQIRTFASGTEIARFDTGGLEIGGVPGSAPNIELNANGTIISTRGFEVNNAGSSQTEPTIKVGHVWGSAAESVAQFGYGVPGSFTYTSEIRRDGSATFSQNVIGREEIVVSSTEDTASDIITNGGGSALSENGFIVSATRATPSAPFAAAFRHMQGTTPDFLITEQGTVQIGGTLNAPSTQNSSPNIELNHTGSGSFAGEVTFAGAWGTDLRAGRIGGGAGLSYIDERGNQAAAVQIYSGAYNIANRKCLISCDGSAYFGGRIEPGLPSNAPNITLNSDGTARFSGGSVGVDADRVFSISSNYNVINYLGPVAPLITGALTSKTFICTGFSNTLTGTNSYDFYYGVDNSGNMYSSGEIACGGIAPWVSGQRNILLAADGTISAVNTTIQPISSERRLKENIVAIDADTAWETIKSTPYYTYNFIGNATTTYGPMADEVPAEMVVQPMVEDEDGNKVARADVEGPIRTYDNGMLQARLYTALQTALTRIEELEARLDAAGV